ncbi:MAG TPA: aldo/keto reductase [Stellaceae bacterium]|jgi:diketogulonate reductase-like aldo/keto reductase|nr:aldo/keto reductase [Stellaceae bacterium]
MTEGLRYVILRGGERVPALGQGTWHMGEDRRRAAEETASLRLGIELGMTLIDTAEMYGGGGAEEVIARAAEGVRDRLFIVSKLYPHNASRAGVAAACERSLKRLETDRIDLYLLHWRGSIPLAETLEGFQRLQRDGKIRYYGVSNFDRADMAEWVALRGGDTVAADQVLYNLSRREPEWDLVPWCREHQVAIMAYTPLGAGHMLRNPALTEIARRRGASPAQIALAWLLRQDGVMVIPKASRAEHVRENRGALDVDLSPEDLAALDRAFPPPRRKTSIGML